MPQLTLMKILTLIFQDQCQLWHWQAMLQDLLIFLTLDPLFGVLGILMHIRGLVFNWGCSVLGLALYGVQ